jgi:hypothetical protein
MSKEIIYPEQEWNIIPQKYEDSEGIGTDGRTNTVYCLGMRNMVPKLREKKEDYNFLKRL